MQETAFDEYDPAEAEPTRFSRLKGIASTVLGALLAMALLVAMGVWFYRLGVRDAHTVPIIRAALEPAKSRPEDPGGMVAPHQDVTSYEVAEDAPAQVAAAVIAPPPPEPRDDDLAMGALAADTLAVPAVDAPTNGVATPEVAPTPSQPQSPDAEQALAGPAANRQAPNRQAPIGSPAPEGRSQSAGDPGSQRPEGTGNTLAQNRTETAPLEGQNAVHSAPAETAPAGTVPRAPERANTQAETTGLPADTQPGDAASELAQSQPEAPAKILGGTKFAPGLSPVAPRRPADLQTRVAQATRAVRDEAVNLSSRAAASRVQIQLAADPSETAVRDIWRRVSRANADILRDRALAIQSTISGGTTYYRLRVGPFRDGTEARAVCAALKARGQDCIVARNG